MKKITKILVPVDFSKPSENAFRYALQLADKIGASIDLLNIVAPRGEGLDYPILVAKATEQSLEIARTNLKEMIDKTLAATGQLLREGPMISSDLEVGTPVESICDVAQREDTSIIIVGSRGENKSRAEKLFGSVAAGVARRAKCAVMIIPENITFSPIEKMTYATDVKDADPFEIWKALELVEPFKPSIKIVHVNLKKEGDLNAWKKLERMKSFFEDRSSELDINFFNIPGKDVQKEVNSFIEKHATDILVMYQPHQGFWDRLFFKSTTKQMALHTSVPFLILKSE